MKSFVIERIDMQKYFSKIVTLAGAPAFYGTDGSNADTRLNIQEQLGVRTKDLKLACYTKLEQVKRALLKTFFAVWRHYDQNSPLAPSGLARPVAVRIFSLEESEK